MVSLTFYGGVREIGGNKILLEDHECGTRILLDFGMSFGQRGLYYQEFLNPRTHSGLKDLMALGLIPDLKGAYRDDPVGGIPFDSNRPFADAVLLSHPHADHANYISLLHPSIPVYSTEPARRILRAMAESGQTSFEREVVEFSFREPGKYRYEKRSRIFFTVEDGERFKVGGLEAECFLVDHSVPGAAGYLIHTSSGPVAYTGDFRLHGRHGHLSERFLRALKKAKPRVLIVEGTNIEEPTGPSEADVIQKAGMALRDYPGKMAFVTFAPRDVFRLTTFFELSQGFDRKLVVNHKIAHLLNVLGNTGLHVPALDSVMVYNQKKRWGLYAEKEYDPWERPYFEHPNAVKSEDLRNDPGSYLIYLDFYSLGELIDIDPPPGAAMIHSQIEPFNEEMEFDFERLHNWLSRFAISYEHAHASGHIYGNALKNAIGDIEPEILVPIHTACPEEFLGLARSVELVDKGRTLVID